MKYIPVSVTRSFGRQLLIAKKYSPQLMFGAGIAGTIVSTVMACKATLELADDLDKMRSNLDDAKTLASNENSKFGTRDLTAVYVGNGLHVAKLYAPAAIVGSISLGLLTGSHISMNRRNAGLTAAYATVSKAYDEYRLRVKEELGEDKELDIYHAAKSDLVDIGEKKLAEIKSVDPTKWSPYARMFDESNPFWVKNAELNRLFIKAKEAYLNHLLQTRGHVFLNEVYEELGFDHCKDGAVVGWVIGPNGDNFIDFGTYEAINQNFQNGWERNALLDFNVDGVMYDKI